MGTQVLCVHFSGLCICEMCVTPERILSCLRNLDFLCKTVSSCISLEAIFSYTAYTQSTGTIAFCWRVTYGEEIPRIQALLSSSIASRPPAPNQRGERETPKRQKPSIDQNPPKTREDLGQQKQNSSSHTYTTQRKTHTLHPPTKNRFGRPAWRRYTRTLLEGSRNCSL